MNEAKYAVMTKAGDVLLNDTMANVISFLGSTEAPLGELAVVPDEDDLEFTAWDFFKANAKIVVQSEKNYEAKKPDAVIGKSKEFVDRHHMMIPGEEDLLASGAALRDGMKVLIANPRHRSDLNEMNNDWDQYQAKVRNRWCTVSEISIVGSNVAFTGTYDDGVKIRWDSMNVSESWLVKVDSLPTEDDEPEDPRKWSVSEYNKRGERMSKVMSIIRDLLLEDRSDKLRNSVVLVPETVDKIMDVFEG